MFSLRLSKSVNNNSSNINIKKCASVLKSSSTAAEARLLPFSGWAADLCEKADSFAGKRHDHDVDFYIQGGCVSR